MFKVGDKVVVNQEWRPEMKGLYEIESIVGTSIEVSPFLPQLSKSHQRMLGFCISSTHIRSATEEELATGHRIDNDMGDDSHIENHVSKNCKVIDYD